MIKSIRTASMKLSIILDGMSVLFNDSINTIGRDFTVGLVCLPDNLWPFRENFKKKANKNERINTFYRSVFFNKMLASWPINPVHFVDLGKMFKMSFIDINNRCILQQIVVFGTKEQLKTGNYQCSLFEKEKKIYQRADAFS